MKKSIITTIRKLGRAEYLSVPKSFKESRAISAQMNHSSWINTTQKFKDGTINYGLTPEINYIQLNKMPYLPIKIINY